MKNAVVTQYRNQENTVDFAVVDFDNEQHLVCLSTEKYIGEIGFGGCNIDSLIVCNNEITLDCNSDVNFLDLAIEAQNLWLAGLNPQKKLPNSSTKRRL